MTHRSPTRSILPRCLENPSGFWTLQIAIEGTPHPALTSFLPHAQRQDNGAEDVDPANDSRCDHVRVSLSKTEVDPVSEAAALLPASVGSGRWHSQGRACTKGTRWSFHYSPCWAVGLHQRLPAPPWVTPGNSEQGTSHSIASSHQKLIDHASYRELDWRLQQDPVPETHQTLPFFIPKPAVWR